MLKRVHLCSSLCLTIPSKPRPFLEALRAMLCVELSYEGSTSSTETHGPVDLWEKTEAKTRPMGAFLSPLSIFIQLFIIASA